MGPNWLLSTSDIDSPSFTYSQEKTKLGVFSSIFIACLRPKKVTGCKILREWRDFIIPTLNSFALAQTYFRTLIVLLDYHCFILLQCFSPCLLKIKLQFDKKASISRGPYRTSLSDATEK